MKIENMNVATVSAINAFTLIIMGAWGYFDGRSMTALIPVFFGVIILVLNNGLKHGAKAQSHVVVLLTLLVIGALVAKPLLAAISDQDTIRIVRIGLMVLTSVWALISFIKHFGAARRAKNNG